MATSDTYEQLLRQQERAVAFLAEASPAKVAQIVEALVKQEHLDSFDLILLGLIASEQPALSDETQLLLARLGDRHRLVAPHLVERADVTEEVLVCLVQNTLSLRSSLNVGKTVGALAHPRLPAWLLSVVYELELLERRNPATDECSNEFMRNPSLPVTARAVLTVQAVDRHQTPYTSPDPSWMYKACGWYGDGEDDGSGQLGDAVYAQIEESFPELVGLPLSFLLPVLATQPIVALGWGEVPSAKDVWAGRLLRKARS